MIVREVLDVVENSKVFGDLHEKLTQELKDYMHLDTTVSEVRKLIEEEIQGGELFV